MARTRSRYASRDARVRMRRGPRAALWIFFAAALIATLVLLVPQLLLPASTGLAGTATVTASVPASRLVATPLAQTAPGSSTAAAPQHLSYPAAGINMAVDPLTPTGADLASQSIVPPPTMQAYWLTSFGKPGVNSVNTTYIVGHSWEDRDAPFNHLSAAAAPGDTLTLATATETVAYRVDSVETHDKDTLKTSEIWDIVPGRLVLISCYTEDPWGKNIVVVASPTKK